MHEDTIVAISTATGAGAIGIVRLSGPDSLRIASEAFKAQQGGDILTAGTFSLTYGHVIEPDSGCRVDEVLVSVMRAPRSYTREDVVEVYCHGGPVAVRAVLQVMVGLGARIADPGEFTRRAFINGRIDLTQAESVAAIVAAKSTGALRTALRQLDGGLSERLRCLRGQLVEVLASIEAGVDFSDEDVDEVDWDAARGTLAEVRDGLGRLLSTALLGEALQRGVRVAIVGKPNVGKSSVLNALVMRERAIVSHEPGTTRDTVEDELEVCGIPLRLVDTAGIRLAAGEVERLGMERSLKALEYAELAVIVADLTEGVDAAALELIERAGSRPCVVIGNKADLVGLDSESFEGLRRAIDDLSHGRSDGETRAACERGSVWVRQASALTGEGMDAVRVLLGEIMAGGTVDMEEPTLGGERQRALAAEAKARVEQALAGIEGATGEELVAEDVRAGAAALGRITGEDLGEDSAGRDLQPVLFGQVAGTARWYCGDPDEWRCDSPEGAGDGHRRGGVRLRVRSHARTGRCTGHASEPGPRPRWRTVVRSARGERGEGSEPGAKGNEGPARSTGRCLAGRAAGGRW